MLTLLYLNEDGDDDDDAYCANKNSSINNNILDRTVQRLSWQLPGWSNHAFFNHWLSNCGFHERVLLRLRATLHQ